LVLVLVFTAKPMKDKVNRDSFLHRTFRMDAKKVKVPQQQTQALKNHKQTSSIR
jgi:hypothetical protein